MQLFTRTLALYTVAGVIAINVVGNMANNTAEGMQRAHEARAEKLCKVNPVYC